MKHPILLLMALAPALLTGCSGAVVSQSPSESAPSDPGGNMAAPTSVRTGLSVSTSCADSGDGSAKTDVTLVAVTVDEAGIIRDCVIDQLETELSFDSTGALLTDPNTTFPTKNELGSDYGMGKVSPIGREWDQQAAALADYVTGKTLEQVRAIPVNEEGRTTDVDLISSATISILPFLEGIEQAIENAG